MSCFLKLHNTQTCWFALSLSSKLFYAFEAFRRQISNTDYWQPSLVFRLQFTDHRIPPTCSSVAKSYPTLCDPMNCSTPGFSVLHYLPEFAQTHVQWDSDAINYLILCRPLLLLPSIFNSIRVFSNESALPWVSRVAGRFFTVWATKEVLLIQFNYFQ